MKKNKHETYTKQQIVDKSMKLLHNFSKDIVVSDFKGISFKSYRIEKGKEQPAILISKESTILFINKDDIYAIRNDESKKVIDYAFNEYERKLRLL